MDFSTRLAVRQTTEDETKRVLQNVSAVIEWETVGYTFIKSDKELAIVRSGALGGDVRELHGGWKYLNLLHMNIEWNEIRLASEPFRKLQ